MLGTYKRVIFLKMAAYLKKFNFLLRYAVLAPSGHNTQPWLFKIAGSNNTIEIYADRSRALPVVDPDDRELVISCGAALGTMRVALRRCGRVPGVARPPAPRA